MDASRAGRQGPSWRSGPTPGRSIATAGRKRPLHQERRRLNSMRKAPHKERRPLNSKRKLPHKERRRLNLMRKPPHKERKALNSMRELPHKERKPLNLMRDLPHEERRRLNSKRKLPHEERRPLHPPAKAPPAKKGQFSPAWRYFAIVPACVSSQAPIGCTTTLFPFSRRYWISFLSSQLRNIKDVINPHNSH